MKKTMTNEAEAWFCNSARVLTCHSSPECRFPPRHRFIRSLSFLHASSIDWLWCDNSAAVLAPNLNGQIGKQSPARPRQYEFKIPKKFLTKVISFKPFTKMVVLGFSVALSPPRSRPSLLMQRLRSVSGKSYWKRAPMIKAEVTFLNGEEAKRLFDEEGYTILDVRDKAQYDRAHIKSCRHIPLFIENNDNDLGTIVKRTVHNNFAGLFFGLQFTKLNPDFVQEVKSQFPSDSKLLVVCQEGLRSAAAASKLDREGFQNLSCITSGLQSVKPDTFDSVGTVELQNAGKAGLVTIQGKISAVLGTVLICAYLFITLFPDQAEKILQMVPQDSS